MWDLHRVENKNLPNNTETDKLTFEQPDTYNNFSDQLQQLMARWMLQTNTK
jgi:hypothetical protein